MASSAPVFFFSEDPEVVALQAMIKGLKHFGARPEMTMRHFKLMLAVELCMKLAKRPATIADIESFAGVKACEITQHINELVAFRYIHEVIPIYGSADPTYKLGALGGTALRAMFKGVRDQKPKDNMIG